MKKQTKPKDWKKDFDGVMFDSDYHKDFKYVFNFVKELLKSQEKEIRKQYENSK